MVRQRSYNARASERRTPCVREPGRDHDLSVQRTMHRALVCDLEQLRPRDVVEWSLQTDDPLDPVDATFPGLALGAVGGVDFLVPQVDSYALERKLLGIGVRANRHRRARAERRGQKIVW